MTTRTRKATSPAPATPAKKTAAKKTTRPRKTTAKKTTPPRLSLVKPDTAPPPAEDRATVVDLRYPLKPRRKLFVGPMGTHEQAAIRAALTSAALYLPVPVRAWNGSQARLTDGTILIHNPGPDRHFTAHIACPHGAVHGWPITSLRDLAAARSITRACGHPHAEPSTHDGIEHDWDKAINYGVAPTAKPKPPAVHFLREGVRRATAAADKTQPLPLDDIADGLAERAEQHAADTDQTPKEHPEP